MEMEGRWTPMKRTAIALNHLISTRFRTDELAVIAFGREARTIDVGNLPGCRHGWSRAPTCTMRCYSHSGTCVGSRMRRRWC